MNDTAPPSFSNDVKEKKEEEYDGSCIDEVILKDLRSGSNRKGAKINKKIMNSIFYNLSHGISLSACGMYVGVCPATLLKWYRRGLEEVNNLTDEQIESVEDVDELLGEYGQFYMGVNRSKSTCVVEIANMLYDRCFENNKEYVAMYLLERQEPEKYNLKYKVQQDINATSSGKNTVEFEFVNGFSSRPPEAQKYITEKLDSLHDKYGDAPNSGEKTDES